MPNLVSLLSVINRPTRWHAPRTYNAHTTNEEMLGLY